MYPTRSHYLQRPGSKEHCRQTTSLELQTLPGPLLKYWTAQELCPHPHRLEPPRWWPGEGPHAWGLQMTDCHPKHHLTHMHTLPSHHIYTRAGTAQWLEHRTSDWKVTGLNPCRSGGRIFFSRVDFLCWLLFWYPFHPRVTAVARKRSWSFRQKCRWQVTAKHTYTLRMWLCTKWHGAWLYGVHRTVRMRWDGCSFMRHQPCQHCKYTTLVDI